MNSTHMVIGLVVVAVLGIGGWYVVAGQKNDDAMMKAEDNSMMKEDSDSMMKADAMMEGDVIIKTNTMMKEDDDTMMKDDGAMMKDN